MRLREFLFLILTVTAVLLVNGSPWQFAATDFAQLHADLVAFLNGEKLYAESTHFPYLSLHRINGEPVVLCPPGYPPWYYSALLPLALFDWASAAKIWAYLSAVMMVGSVFLLLKQGSRTRLALSLAVLLYGPSLLQIHIGQQTTVLLLGLALTCESIANRRAVFLGLVSLS